MSVINYSVECISTYAQLNTESKTPDAINYKDKLYVLNNQLDFKNCIITKILYGTMSAEKMFAYMHIKKAEKEYKIIQYQNQSFLLQKKINVQSFIGKNFLLIRKKTAMPIESNEKKQKDEVIITKVATSSLNSRNASIMNESRSSESFPQGNQSQKSSINFILNTPSGEEVIQDSGPSQRISNVPNIGYIERKSASYASTQLCLHIDTENHKRKRCTQNNEVEIKQPKRGESTNSRELTVNNSNVQTTPQQSCYRCKTQYTYKWHRGPVKKTFLCNLCILKFPRSRKSLTRTGNI